MGNKVIALAGLSGSGKSTLARTVESEHFVTVVDVDGLFKEAVRREGFERESPFLLRHGVVGATGMIRDIALSQVLEGLKHSDVLVDNLYDVRLHSAIVEAVGRDHITVIAVRASFAERLRRTSARGMAPVKTVLSDTIKYVAGLGKIEKDADFTIKKRSIGLAIATYEQKILAPKIAH